MRRRVRPVLILLLTVGLLAFSLRNADLRGVWAETRRADAVPLLLALIATLATYALRALRWQYLLAPLGRRGSASRSATTVIGFAASFLLPARAGEVIRPYLLARREGLSAPAAFATIILERLLDLARRAAAVRAVRADGRPGRRQRDPPSSRESRSAARSPRSPRWPASACFFVAGRSSRTGSDGWPSARSASCRRGSSQPLARLRRDVHPGSGRDAAAAAGCSSSLALSFPLWLSIAAGIWLTSRAFHITFPLSGFVPRDGGAGGRRGGADARRDRRLPRGVPDSRWRRSSRAPPDRAVGAAFVLHAISFVPVTILGCCSW